MTTTARGSFRFHCIVPAYAFISNLIQTKLLMLMTYVTRAPDRWHFNAYVELFPPSFTALSLIIWPESVCRRWIQTWSEFAHTTHRFGWAIVANGVVLATRRDSFYLFSGWAKFVLRRKHPASSGCFVVKTGEEASWSWALWLAILASINRA